MKEIKLIKNSIFIIIVLYIGWVVFNLDELSRYNLVIASLYTEVDVYKEFTLGLLVALFITLYVIIFLKPYLSFWIIKIFIGLFVLILRESQRAFDPANYYGNGVYNVAQYEFGAAPTYTVMHITNFLSNFTGESYYALKVLFSFIGFLGVIFFYKAFLHIITKNKLQDTGNFKLWIFLLPSIIFWTNNIGKDVLVFFSLGLFTFSAVHLIDKFNPIYLIIIILTLFLTLYIRPWYPVIMVTALGLYYTNFKSIKNIFMLLLFSPLIFILFSMILEHFNINSFDAIFLKITDISTGFSRGNAAIEINKITGLDTYILYFIPNSFTALFRPMIYEVRNFGMLLSSIENTLLLYLFIRYILGNLKIIFQNKYMRFLFLFIISWLLFYVIPQGNLGTSVRFKVQILPIMLTLFYISKLTQTANKTANVTEH